MRVHLICPSSINSIREMVCASFTKVERHLFPLSCTKSGRDESWYRRIRFVSHVLRGWHRPQVSLLLLPAVSRYNPMLALTFGQKTNTRTSKTHKQSRYNKLCGLMLGACLTETVKNPMDLVLFLWIAETLEFSVQHKQYKNQCFLQGLGLPTTTTSYPIQCWRLLLFKNQYRTPQNAQNEVVTRNCVD